MDIEYFNQRISCDVKECKYYDNNQEKCTLGQIKVSGQNTKEETYCDSFEKEESN